MDLPMAERILGCSYWTLRDLVLNGPVPAVRMPSPRAREDRTLRRTLIDSRRYNIVSACDLVEAAKKLNAIQLVQLPPIPILTGTIWAPSPVRTTLADQ